MKIIKINGRYIVTDVQAIKTKKNRFRPLLEALGVWFYFFLLGILWSLIKYLEILWK